MRSKKRHFGMKGGGKSTNRGQKGQSPAEPSYQEGGWKKTRGNSTKKGREEKNCFFVRSRRGDNNGLVGKNEKRSLNSQLLNGYPG